MYKLLIILSLISFPLRAQQKIDVQKVDSLSYNYYMVGDWKQLIEIGKIADENSIDFMYLQQRLGYANFMLGNNYSAIKHYSNALKFDPADQISHTYLYYAAIQVGDNDMAMFHASKLTPESQQYFKLKSFKPLDAIDFEFNYKINDSDVRSNPDYTRIGINSRLNYRLNIYQSISRYNQINDLYTNIQQDEYFALLSYNLWSRTAVRFGYHYLNAKVDDAMYNLKDTFKTNVFTGSVTHKIGRFEMGVSSSFLTGDTLQVQTGAHFSFVLPGQFKPYFKSSVYSINRNGVNRLVYSQSAGFLATPKLWLEGEITLGDLDNYVENNGLYVYNSLDATKFRIGTTAFWYVSPKITLFANYSYNKKLISNSLTYYNQNSLSGGFIWKL